MNRRTFGLLAFAAFAAACSENGDVTGPDASLQPAFDGVGGPGNVYTMSNATAGNTILAYERSQDGSLAFVAEYPTGGLGTGGGLGNQGGLATAPGGRWIFAVNAGDNTISVFAHGPDGNLALTDLVSSGGAMPISVTHHDNVLYVLNAGGDGNIVGFDFDNGQLTMIAGSERPLSQSAPGPAQIEFVRNGAQLVVTEKSTNRILVYNIDRRTRMASQPVVNVSVGTTPFGFAFDNRGRLIVSNAAGGAAGAGSLSAYAIRKNGTLEVTAAEVPNFQAAPCWVVVTKDGRYTYTTNTGSNTTSGYRIHPHGQLELLDPSGVSGSNTGAPIDAAVTRLGGKYLYVLNAAGNAIDAFAIESNGDLTPVAGGVTGLPAGTNGLVAY